VPGGIDHAVVSLLPDGVLRSRLGQAGARVIELPAGKRGPAGALLLRTLGTEIAGGKPDLVHTWMYHSNLALAVSPTSKHPSRKSPHGSATEPPSRTLKWIGTSRRQMPASNLNTSTLTLREAGQ
jgi:hypothetical protein